MPFWELPRFPHLGWPSLNTEGWEGATWFSFTYSFTYFLPIKAFQGGNHPISLEALNSNWIPQWG